MGGQETGHFLGEGGVIWEMALPLPEVMQDKVTKGYLRRVNPDGSPYVEPVEGDEPPPEPKPPAQSASKAEWVGWAVDHPDESRRLSPDDAEALTKADLIEKFGKD